jgi:RHS repeat-associated protein
MKPRSGVFFAVVLLAGPVRGQPADAVPQPSAASATESTAVTVADADPLDFAPTESSTESSPPANTANTDSDIEFYHLDALGSVRMVTNRTGAVIARYDYLPFGEAIPSSIAGRNQVTAYAAIVGTRRFTGKERDFESGLDYFGARYMSAAQGHFTTPDPRNAGADPTNPQSWNGYSYALNNPTKYVDPDGRSAAIGALFGASFAGVAQAYREIKSGNDCWSSGCNRRIVAAMVGGAVTGSVGGLGVSVESPVILGMFGGALGDSTEAIVNGEKPTPEGALAGAVGSVPGSVAGKFGGQVVGEFFEMSGTAQQLTSKMSKESVQAVTNPNPIRARTFNFLANRTATKLVLGAHRAVATGHAVTHSLVDEIVAPLLAPKPLPTPQPIPTPTAPK